MMKSRYVRNKKLGYNFSRLMVIQKENEGICSKYSPPDLLSIRSPSLFSPGNQLL